MLGYWRQLRSARDAHPRLAAHGRPGRPRARRRAPLRGRIGTSSSRAASIAAALVERALLASPRVAQAAVFGLPDVSLAGVVAAVDARIADSQLKGGS